MSGTIALHGGGEFLPGDEVVLEALIAAAPRRDDDPIRIAVVPTAAARGRPALAAANGVAAFELVAIGMSRAVMAEEVRIVDTASAADVGLATRLEQADIIYLPGGDPDIIPALLPQSAAWRAIAGAHERGGVLAGASAGAMALAERTWTPSGVVPGLALVGGIVVVPHADAGAWDRWRERVGGEPADGMAILGVAERTAVMIPGDHGLPWQVVGAGEVRWLRADAFDPVVVRAGGSFVRDHRPT